MDTLTHIMFPLIIVKVWRKEIDIKNLILIAFFGILPDFDIFLGVHRSLFHSLIFILPLFGALIILDKKFNFEFSKFLILATTSHLVIDFLAGGLPFLYPFVKLIVGIEFPLVMKYDTYPYLVEYLPRIVIKKPTPVYGKTFDLVSSFGIVCLVLLVILNVKRIRTSPELI